MLGRKYICECSCNNPEHILIFHHYIDEEYNCNEVDVYFMSRWQASFWERCKLAFKYVFKHEEMRTSDTVIFTKDNIKQLEKFIKEYKKRYN